ncbi:MAG: phosphatase PAP2 family protein [Prevotellaceae bacterium]|jgi:undecaprenyl-diphosphatase|nr:phosphatase PAP2 family protein [Prevotellaceae bacterium]
MTFFEKILNIDQEILIRINSCYSVFFDDFFYIYSGKLAWILTAAAIIFVIVKTQKKDFWIPLLSIVLLIALSDQISSGLLKPLFERPRPSREPLLDGLVHIVHNHRGGGFSFPSSHATNGFAFAVFTALLFKNRLYSCIIFFWASITAYSRMYLAMHYPLDILGGIIVGITVGFGVFYLLKWIFPKCCKKPIENKYSSFIATVFLLTLTAISLWHSKLLFLA